MRHGGGHASAYGDKPAWSARAGHVLIVDDETAIRELLADVLSAEGYQVTTASNGSAALALIDGYVPDVILLDLMMPVMDGFKFRAQQLGRPELATIPVIILSAMYNPAADSDGLRPHAFLSKPFDLDCVVSAVAAAVPR